MRQVVPAVQSFTTGMVKGTAKPGKKTWIVLAALAVVIVILAIALPSKNNKPKSTINAYERPPSAVQENIDGLKNSKNLADRRNLASNYVANGEYAKAEETARSVAEQSKSTEDYMSLLTICAGNNVPDKQSCLDWAVSNLKPQLNKLTFYQVYVVGSMLDDAGDKKNAVTFYQRAYDIYDPAKADAYTKSKAQIKQRIAQLNA